MKNRKIVLNGMAKHKKKQAEKAKEKEGIKDLRGFCSSVIANFTICFIPVVEREERLDNTRHPEKSEKTGNKHKHFPLSDLGRSKITLCKYYADNQEYNSLQQLKKL
jgi:hypothetical protein